MKKNLFLILVATLFILVLFYFYDERITILNKEYYDDNILINYPYFNNIIIDNYLNDYLNSYIDEKDLNSSLFIDYDYLKLDEIIELIFYIYQEKESVIKKETRKIDIDLVSSQIKQNTKIIDKGILYDKSNQYIIDNNNSMIALTFDDGPNHNTSRVLDILEKYNVKATFFILGSNINGNEKIIKRMNDLGMEIGNHMYSHKLLTKLENDKILSEIKEVDNLIFNITNKYPTLVRPSYGTVNDRIKKIIDKPIIIWNIDTLDWKNHNSKEIANKVLKKAKNGDIVLMHDIYRATANSLEIIIPKLLENGYELVTVSELLNNNNITIKPGKVYSNA